VVAFLEPREYEAALEAAGFQDVSVEFTHEVADGLHGAIVKARKPDEAPTPVGRPLPVASASSGCC
jgi:hypothetical protein